MSRSRTPGCTCRATTHSRAPPPIQSMEASPRPRSIHPQPRFARPERNPCRFSPKNTRTRRTPMSEMTANNSSPRRSRRGVRARGMDPPKLRPACRAGERGAGSGTIRADRARGMQHRDRSLLPAPSLFYRVMSAFPDRVIIRNARQHNLKGITVELPRRALSVITGPSGPGKSSLAFDTLYAEGQRRYIESLSTYAKQFLERMPKPLVDGIDGISPAVAIEQKNPTTTSRSTVGTATEIYDFLRLLWARVGTPYCVKCGRGVKADTVQEGGDAVNADCGLPIAESTGRVSESAIRNPQSAIVVSFPLPPSAHRPDVEVAGQLRAAGFVRAQVDGALVRLDAPEAERRGGGGAAALGGVGAAPRGGAGSGGGAGWGAPARRRRRGRAWE